MNNKYSKGDRVLTDYGPAIINFVYEDDEDLSNIQYNITGINISGAIYENQIIEILKNKYNLSEYVFWHGISIETTEIHTPEKPCSAVIVQVHANKKTVNYTIETEKGNRYVVKEHMISKL